MQSRSVTTTVSHTVKLTSQFGWIPQNVQLGMCLALIAASIVFAMYLQRQGAAADAVLKYGVLDIEAPWSSERANTIRTLLGDDGIAAARAQTRLDFVFLVLYPLAISLACSLVACRSARRSSHARRGRSGLRDLWPGAVARASCASSFRLIRAHRHDMAQPRPPELLTPVTA